MIDIIGRLRAALTDSAETQSMKDVIGNKADTALQVATAADSVMRYIKGLLLSQSRIRASLDFWSDPQEEIAVPAVAATLVFTPTVTVANIPAGATVVKVMAMFKFRMVENTFAGANALDGATVPNTSQVIQVDDSVATGYVDGINFADNQFTFTAAGREGGDVFIGSINVAARVDGNDVYTFRWLLRKADQDFINFNDCQVGLRIWYSV